MLETKLSRSADDVVVALIGDFDTSAAIEIEPQFSHLADNVPGNLVLDFSQLQYLNSTALRTLIKLDSALKARDRRLLLKGVTMRVYRVLGYCGLDRYFKVELCEVLPPSFSAFRITP